jgi:hypothetical protein
MPASLGISEREIGVARPHHHIGECMYDFLTSGPLCLHHRMSQQPSSKNAFPSSSQRDILKQKEYFVHTTREEPPNGGSMDCRPCGFALSGSAAS